MRELPPYSGENTTCVKCHNPSAGTMHLGFGECVHGSVGGQLEVIGFDPNERLHRQCYRCGFMWDEAVADAAPPVDVRETQPFRPLGTTGPDALIYDDPSTTSYTITNPLEKP